MEEKAKAEGGGLRLIGALVVAEAVVGHAQGLGQEPALAVVLVQEGLDAGVAVAARGVDLLLYVVQGDQGLDGVAEFGILVFVDAPKAFLREESVDAGRTGVENATRDVWSELRGGNTMTETSEGDGVMTNHARLREKLKAGTLAMRLADAYDAAHTNEENRDALKQVVEDELDKARKNLEQDENQVG